MCRIKFADQGEFVQLPGCSCEKRFGFPDKMSMINSPILPITPQSLTLNTNGSSSSNSDFEQLYPIEKRAQRNAEAIRNEDPVLLKRREKQNAAARKCRAKKASELKSMELRVDELEKEKFDLTVKVSILEQEKISWKAQQENLENYLQSLKNELAASQAVFINNKNDQ